VEDLTALYQQIEQLSPEGRAALAGYVKFLRWQDEQKQRAELPDWSFSFIEAFHEATVHASLKPGGMDVKLAPATVGGESQPALWAHPPVAGQTIIEYYVPIPKQVRHIHLRLAVGIRDGAQISENNLVAFGVKMNGLRVWGLQFNDTSWHTLKLPLTVAVGDIVRFEFTTEALGSHKWTWAVWGNPELIGMTNDQ
jgi:hypothetical protein